MTDDPARMREWITILARERDGAIANAREVRDQLSEAAGMCQTLKWQLEEVTAERDALKVGLHLLDARLNDLTRRAERESARLNADLDAALAVAQDLRNGNDSSLRREYARGFDHGVASSAVDTPARTKILVVCSLCNYPWSGPAHQCPPDDDIPSGVPCIDMP